MDRTLDHQVNERDVLELSGADALCAFFSTLGYDTSKRIVQQPGHLGITAEATLRQIRRIERLADEDGLFQVYLFELKSVTVMTTRALARAFRNRAGNYLLVLTADFERLDLVLLSRVIPDAGDDSGIGNRQVDIVPRVLTVERRKPDQVRLRVLRRLTRTEPDPIAQFEKLAAAFDTAYWSSESFNNRALFSDYFLEQRLRERAEWTEDPKTVYSELLKLYQGAASRLFNCDEAAVRADVIEPAVRALGFSFRFGKKADSDSTEPDYVLTGGGGAKPLAFCLAYTWGRSLDGKDPQRDKQTPDENPGLVVVSLLEKNVAPWGIVTNGKIWRLYSAGAHSRATNYFEQDLEEILLQTGPLAHDPARSFRYFWLLFRRQAFEPATAGSPGQPAGVSFDDAVLAGSKDYAKRLGERLKDRVFKEVFPHLARGFIEDLKGSNKWRTKDERAQLDEVYCGTLSLLYRLLFLLYAESRDLLPVRETRDYFEISLDKIKKEITERAGGVCDEADGRICAAYTDGSFELYGRLARLFSIIDKGSPDQNVPFYNGGLFMTDPEADDCSPEAESARFLRSAAVPDCHLALAIDLLARDEDEKSHALVFIDYKSLGVRQLGSIYEGLLEFDLRIAGEDLGIIKDKGSELYVALDRMDPDAAGRAAKRGNVVRRGEIYLENDKHERRATGSYYTPDHIVKYIVAHAVGPVLEAKLDTLRPALRRAEIERKAFEKKEAEKVRHGMKAAPAGLLSDADRKIVDEIFGLKVLDPAMGSGHFLVETVDFVTEKIIDFLNGFRWNPATAHLEEMRRSIASGLEDQGITIDARRLVDVNLLKRHVLKRCIYGVDLNPMAVELAKVSLWLDCFTLGAPLSFLDHHLRCGNSLIGATEKDLHDAEKGQLDLLGGSRFEGAKTAVGGMIAVGALPDVTTAQVKESRRQYGIASAALDPVKRIFDVWTSQWFGNEPSFDGKGKRKIEHNPAIKFIRSGRAQDWAYNPAAVYPKLPKHHMEVVDKALAAATEKRFFHWELEFPEVFYGPRPGTARGFERIEGAGFDAVIGNPPYVRVQKLRQYDPDAVDYLGERYASAVSNFDIYLPFFEKGLEICRGNVSYIAPNKWFATDYGRGLRKLLAEKRALNRVVDFKDFQLFEGATNYTCILFLNRKQNETIAYVDASRGVIEGEISVDAKNLPIDGGGWMFNSDKESVLLDKLLHGDFLRLKDIRDRAFQGLRTSDNDVYVVVADGPPKGGLFTVQAKATGEAHKIEAGLLKPLLSGDEIRAFSLTHSGQWIIFPYDINGSRPELFSEKTLKSEFPHGWKYLKKCEPRLRAREREAFDGPGWWQYGRNQNLDLFEQPKIMLPGYNVKPSAGFDAEGRYYHVSGYSITLKKECAYSYESITCLLNSKLIFWYLGKVGVALQRGFVEFRPQYLDKVPIPPLPLKLSKGSLDADVCAAFGIEPEEMEGMK